MKQKAKKQKIRSKKAQGIFSFVEMTEEAEASIQDWNGDV